uniref:Uncharacterized protein n=1 Tax=Eptatretus burgeri TaxID=7764 RepID=A0A8C4QQE4_EPTBU
MPFLRRWGSDDAASIFEEAGVAVLTNFYIPRSYERRDFEDSPRQLEVAKDGHFQEPSRIRSDFPETWIWEDSLTRANGIASITATVPDTITSWIASAFSVGPRFGLGLASPQELISFLPFFIYLDLPYSIIRGEDFLLKVVVFNYLSQDQQVAVTLKESESFELYSARQIIITVRRKEGASLAFALSPKTLGQVPMTVKAQSAHASDAITDHVLVKAEGKRRTFSKAVLIDRRSGETNVTSEILKFTYPSNMVQGSAVAYVSAVGDIMGPSIEGLQHLVQMPYGCGEQNMVKFAPNVYVLQYLEATDKSFESLRQKVISYMVRGYQRQLNYQRQDGSYSAFGDSDRSGSTWLTAFVFKCFTQASTFMFIDQHQMHRTYIWLVEQWSDDGEFQEAGRLLDAPILGASTNPVALTASVVTSLLSNPDNWDMKVKASIAYLERAVGRSIENHRDLALVTYALVLGKSEDAATALDQLNHHAILDGDVMHWPNQNPTLLHSASSIETAAYALLAHLKLGLIEEGLPIMNWLSQQRSHLGGFVSTQDTVVALEAMSAFAIEMSRGDFNLQLTVYTTVMQNTLSINHENALLLQKVQIPTVETLGSLTVNVQAKGTGFAILQLNVLYNVKEEMPENEPFELLVNIDDVTGEGSLHYTVHICTRRKSRVNGGMVLLEVGMLSGFSPGDINLQAAIKRVEKKKGKLFIYFNEINETMICVEILASQSTPIGKVKEANVIVSDFYEPSRKTERSYKSNALEEVSICDICGDQCQDCVNT